MLALKYLLFTAATGLFFTAGAVIAYDLWLELQYRRDLNTNPEVQPHPLRWRTSIAFVAIAWCPLHRDLQREQRVL
jgi:hypothetical protein